MDKNQSFVTEKDLNLDSNHYVSNHSYVDFGGRVKPKISKLQNLFNIQSPLVKSLLRFLIIAFEFITIAWIVITITFFLINSIPGSTTLTTGLDESAKLAVEARYGLDKPLIQRYFLYLNNLLHGDFGISYSVFPGQNINDFVWIRFYKSFLIGIFSVMITLGIGIPVGVWVGMNPDKLPDHIATVVVSVFSSIPSLVFALWLLLIGRALGIPYLYVETDLATYVLPGLALSLGSIIVYIKYIRTELNRELNSQHAKFCYLKGLSKSRFVWTHALKPSLFPIATFFPVVIFGSFIGSMFVEQIFFITGSGGLLLHAITSKDYNIILFMVTLFSLITILSYTCRDALYKAIDPRVRRRR
ncbi:oligopeptide ABC transporter permease protein (OppB) [Mycoplasmopsis californica HAZ160_1]|uniref:Oligopeptide ABC transporter permease protein (OppB) n=1 Tax=Mycoplasmopsis californica HAZ160_1 TaxID=1397850 RepID=A0AAT9F8K0_9BACT|nr:ABC transporter permease [Mycoplasmopsis californica]BAP01229.1 oligopeptide ABC transporter permease protein (OppB) [Mycoplasmopsis californica HAZ160_1]BBG41103.1 oligopeptide ABC transporter permease protein [Mycoplasmopsis californica]BBG41696.1 oligopeptide ABC transporter permease protein [Mycoplasmopsis californica]BBG42290.1 oligopeptide ABC transporter permease protein [Mycoplasmopsis californica]BBG42865.1 oligopeptide ABC transporter permease protein [Mycoplasmopsis californica]